MLRVSTSHLNFASKRLGFTSVQCRDAMLRVSTSRLNFASQLRISASRLDREASLARARVETETRSIASLRKLIAGK